MFSELSCIDKNITAHVHTYYRSSLCFLFENKFAYKCMVCSHISINGQADFCIIKIYLMCKYQ